MISSKTVNDLTESTIHFSRRLNSCAKIYLSSWNKWRGESVVSKFKFFVLKLWEFARLFAGMACVNLVSPPKNLNSNATLQRDTRGFNAALSHWIPSVSVVQFTVQMSKLNGLGKTHRERTFVAEQKTSLALLQRGCEVLAENFDFFLQAARVSEIIISVGRLKLYFPHW